MTDKKTTTPIYKRWWFITIIVILFIGMIVPSENPEPLQEPIETTTPMEVVETELIEVDYPIIVEVSTLINSSPQDAESILGSGDRTYYEGFGDISWTTDEYYIEINYVDEKSEYVFFNYDKAEATREEILAATNLDSNSQNYYFKVQEWLDQKEAVLFKSPEIAGIHVYSK